MVDVKSLVVGSIEEKEENYRKLMKHRLGKLPIVNTKGDLVALYCRSDLLKVSPLPSE